ncbi:MAG: 2Fe-2S iron-sulfur cluster-binding protein [Nitrospirales bacterium]|nr:2Fe-2S iron-sulfur cluster-binding protein [Nitrospirales bacterium]
MPLVFFERQGKTVRCNAGWNLRRLALANKIPVYHGFDKVINCRGQGLCGTCKVEVYASEDFDVNPRTAMEEKKLRKFTNPSLRLSCQVKVHGNIRVKTYPVELMKRDEEVVAPPLVSAG